MKSSNSGGTCKFHNVRFYSVHPRGINVFAWEKKSKQLAIARDDASIEIWNLKHAPHMQRVIFAEMKASVEALSWSNGRLFSAGLEGSIVEWNLQSATVRHKHLVTGTAIWCLDVNRERTLIAAGTEEGFLNLFRIVDDGIEYERVMDKQEGRIMCCKFDHSGEFLVTGSIDAVRIWNVKLGQAIQKMMTGRSEQYKETIIWSLVVLKDFTIISSDSRGQLTIWDGKKSAEIESIQVLKSDALCVAVNEAEDTLFCSGIDPLISKYSLTTVKNKTMVTQKWVKSIDYHLHNHDVKALIATENSVISGGVNGYLTIVSYPPKVVTRCGPFLPGPCATIASTARLILLKYIDYLEVWRLGSPTNSSLIRPEKDNNDDDDGGDNNKDTNDTPFDIVDSKYVTLSAGPERLIQMRSRNDEPIVCATISHDGHWLLYSSLSNVRLFHCTHTPHAQSTLKRINELPEQLVPCARALFSARGNQLLIAKHEGQVEVFTLDQAGIIQHKQTISTNKTLKDSIHLMAMSECGKYLACAGLCNTIAVWSQESRLRKGDSAWKHHINLPKYSLAPTALAINSVTKRLVAIFSDCKIFEYDLEEMQFTFSAIIKQINFAAYIINNITFDARNEDIIVLHNEKMAFVLNKCKTANDDGEDGDVGVTTTKIAKLCVNGDNKIDRGYAIKSIKRCDNLVHLSWLGVDEIIAVNVNEASMVEKLPPAMRKKKFGAT